MNKQKWTLAGSAGLGAGLGAGLMYLLDPQGGGRRRAITRDKTAHALRKGGEAARKTSRHLSNRTKGLVAGAGSKLRRGEADDQVLRDRVRSKLGRVVSHPSALEMTVEDGRVILAGPVLASEVGRLLAKVHGVKGVKDVENRLEIHEYAGNVPALQGHGRNASWGDRASKAGLLAGGALAVAGLKRRDKMGAALGAVGLALLARGLKNRNGHAGKDLLDQENHTAGHGSAPHRGTHDLSAAGFEGALNQAEREFQTSLP